MVRSLVTTGWQRGPSAISEMKKKYIYTYPTYEYLTKRWPSCLTVVTKDLAILIPVPIYNIERERDYGTIFFFNRDESSGALGLCNVCMYVCMATHVAKVWINRVRLPILLVVG